MRRMVAEQRQAAVGLASIAQERPASFVLGFIAGFVDIAGYIALFGLFSANMTGNLVLAGVELMQPQGGIVASRVMALPVFMLGVALGWLIAVYAKRLGWPVGSVLAACEAIALTLFLAMGKIYAPRLHAASQQTLILLIGCFALIAMGLQNALSRELFADMPATTGMTSNLSLFVLDSAELINARLRRQPLVTTATTRQRYARLVAVLGGLVLGATTGAYGMHYLTLWSLAIPITLAVLLAIAMRGTRSG
jgi:uncharacterized membrane protein YoaK (UPF0700 family)